MQLARDIWFISDTHLNHANILNFVDEKGQRIRPFSSVSEMNERILDRWNSVVKPGDIVWHLGDVAFGTQEDFKSLWPKFNGSKRLVVGNHDDIKFLSSGGFFKKVVFWRYFHEERIIFSHVPLHPSTFEYKKGGCLNVHGHIHHNASPPGPYFNISCEAINYTPMHLDTLTQIAKEKLDT